MIFQGKLEVKKLASLALDFFFSFFISQDGKPFFRLGEKQYIESSIYRSTLARGQIADSVESARLLPPRFLISINDDFSTSKVQVTFKGNGTAVTNEQFHWIPLSTS